MSQISTPMKIAGIAALVFAALWFTVMKPKDPVAEPVAATPAPAAATTTPRAAAGGAAAQSATGKLVEKANTAGAAASADAKKSESQTGEDTPSTPAAASSAASSAGSSSAATPASTPARTTPATKASEDDAKPSASQTRADRVIEDVTKDLAKNHAVVVLIWSKNNPEDRELQRRVTREINRRKGKVRIYLIPVAEVGRYDGLLSGLAIGQTPSTIVIAPNHEAKVLGGLTSTARIDRLTSSAIQLKAPVSKTTP